MVRTARRPLAAALVAAMVPLPLHPVDRHRKPERSHLRSVHVRPAHKSGKRPRTHQRHLRKHQRRVGANAPLGTNAALALTVGRPHRTSPREAHAAGDPSDTISDFKFTPHAITIHAGDTITWTNVGPSPHTATASNGSFDTGTLKKGQSASHTFSTPGTFTYICTIHPFMHGTVVVLGNTSSQTTPTTSGSGSGSHGKPAQTSSPSSARSGAPTSPATGSAATTPSAGGRSLPNTGLDLPATLFTSAVLIGGGVGVRRAARRIRVR